MIPEIFFKITWGEKNMGRDCRLGWGRSGHELRVVEAGLWVCGDLTCYFVNYYAYSKFSKIKNFKSLHSFKKEVH